ncbi:MAG: hypothetical protein IJY25_04580 [Bacilli bacterium]|nr:hypothetical protein [Bacilli bacterium]
MQENKGLDLISLSVEAEAKLNYDLQQELEHTKEQLTFAVSTLELNKKEFAEKNEIIHSLESKLKDKDKEIYVLQKKLIASQENEMNLSQLM